jgi:hypothetical protein
VASVATTPSLNFNLIDIAANAKQFQNLSDCCTVKNKPDKDRNSDDFFLQNVYDLKKSMKQSGIKEVRS